MSPIWKQVNEDTCSPGTLLTCSPTLTRRAGSKWILSVFARGSRNGQSTNDHWNCSWSRWLNPSKLRWNVLLVCVNRVIAVAHSSSLIQTKERATWMRLDASQLRFSYRREAISRDWTEREQPQ